MNINLFTRRDFSVRMAAFCSGLGIAGLALTPEGIARTVRQAAGASSDSEISHSAESIHQEVIFKARRNRVYEALTDPTQFDKVVKLSAAVQSNMMLGNKPTEISRGVGGAFRLFGGYITGLQIELIPNERIIQAWRSASWGAGLYSIASFDLKEQGSETKLLFDHRGFPKGAAGSLLEGWNGNYWEPMRKVLA
jgi:activator of HSP90 ATPase